jgi:hypothetical protein
MLNDLTSIYIPIPLQVLYCKEARCYSIINGAIIVVSEALDRFNSTISDNAEHTINIRKVVTHLESLEKLLLTALSEPFKSIKKRRYYLFMLVRQAYKMNRIAFSMLTLMASSSLSTL